MRAVVEAVGETAARDCRRAPWLPLSTLMSIRAGGSQVVRANPAAETRWGGVGRCTTLELSPSTRTQRPRRARMLGHAVCRSTMRMEGKAANSTPGKQTSIMSGTRLARLDSMQRRRRRFGPVARLDFCLSSEWAPPHAYAHMHLMHHPCPRPDVGG